jgi:hypothetical protein
MRRIDFPEWREVLTQAELPERIKCSRSTRVASGRQEGLAGVESGLPDHVTAQEVLLPNGAELSRLD